MSIKILVRTDDAGMAANVGGPVHSDYREFTVESKELEAFLREADTWAYIKRYIVGELKP